MTRVERLADHMRSYLSPTVSAKSPPAPSVFGSMSEHFVLEFERPEREYLGLVLTLLW
jgi:hypothetical protein